MRSVLKWTGIVLGALVGLIVVAGAVLNIVVGAQLDKPYDVSAEEIHVPDDEAAIARGQHLAEALAGCTGCHGQDLGGGLIFEDPAIGAIYAPNLTSGHEEEGHDHEGAELVGAIRYGVDHDGKTLLVMPSDDYYYLSEEDLGAIIAYVQSVPPVEEEVEEEVPDSNLTFMGRVLVGLGAFGEIRSAELVDWTAPRPAVPPPGATAEYGEYLATISGCRTCHGSDLGGSQGPEPGAPFSPNLTPGGELGEWSEEDFIATLRTGTTPEGEDLDEEFMPWDEFAKASDDELSAIWLYLQSLPAVSSAE